MVAAQVTSGCRLNYPSFLCIPSLEAQQSSETFLCVLSSCKFEGASRQPCILSLGNNSVEKFVSTLPVVNNSS